MGAAQRKVIVVGAGSGIGAATAAHFHERGDHVLAVDVRESDTPATEFRRCDLRNPSDVEDLLRDVGSGWDLLAHVAGVPGTAPAAEVMKINYFGMRLMALGMLPLLQPGGSIVAVASTAGVGWEMRAAQLEDLLSATDPAAVESWLAGQDPSYPVYNTSKEAVILFAKRLSGPAWAKYGVRINTVSPGPTETPILTDFEESMGRDLLDTVRTTVGRHATVDDIVPIIAFLGSPEARWITGQDIRADGGFVNSLLAGPPIAL
ncbi:SDR family oxidoreductase [Aldersonia kunmingensis]|uniref:SDR family oxidoreductase n=1 Tax=Aldersonia kunmingensis TaxID=408066 RepID=UPI00082BDE59|nr:SDR family oxidoreductase [Aldersonia kunmingensis]